MSEPLGASGAASASGAGGASGAPATLDPTAALGPRVSAAITAAFGDGFAGADPVLRPGQGADLQSNAAMALARRAHQAPQAAAQAIIDHLDAADILDSATVSGPGFINLALGDAWITGQLAAMSADPGLGVPSQTVQRVIIDYSAPNVAKEMHVGHLRTTVVGDSLARTLERLGHQVIRQNHIGDWGTPFGMLVERLAEVEGTDAARLVESDPNAFYQSARERFDGDDAFAERARARVVALQAGDADTLAQWQGLIDRSKRYFNRIYTRLGVTLADADLAGESTYNAALAGICDELEAAGLARISDGALCVFLDGHLGRDGQPLPLIIRKSDGGYGYATTDLATIRYRVGELAGDRILYVVGASQALHFEMVWETARLAGWLGGDVAPVHVKIGNVLGGDRKILRTRSGESLRLMSLLEEAITRAASVLEAERPELDGEARGVLAAQIGIAAVKYADLSVAHDSEYVFDLDRMVALTGNTGGYLQYAAARINSIFRAAGADASASGPIRLDDPAERALGLALLEYGRVVALVGETLEPHRLCAYLFALAQAFSGFYEACPVLKADGEVRASRLGLCGLTLAVLRDGLDLLGIAAPERM